MHEFDLPGCLRRIRRVADLSQRELAAILAVSKSALGRAESGAQGLDARLLARAAARAGLRLALLDADGGEVAPMRPDTVRDGAHRRFPAHLDTRYGDEDWWHGRERYSRTRPRYTFDRHRPTRDRWTRRDGVPSDHLVPQPGDSPSERAAARRAAAARLRAEERERAFLAGELRGPDDGPTCTCPPTCDELDDWSGRPVHAEDCPCACDIG